MKLSEIQFASEGLGQFWQAHKPESKIAILPMHAEKWFLVKKEGDWDKTLEKVDVFIGDGVGLAAGYWFLTGKVIKKVSGVDLINQLVKEAPQTSVYLWGTTEKSIRGAADSYKKQGLNVVGFHDGFTGEDKDILAEIKKSGAQIVFVGMGARRAAQLIVKIKEELGVSAMTAGGSFDVAGGEFKRAPKLFQKIGLEWLWRMLLEPKRFKRLPALFGFVWFCLKEKVGR